MMRTNKRQRLEWSGLKPLTECPTQTALTNKLQVSDIIEWAIGQIDDGSSMQIWQTTFSVSEEYLRRLVLLKERCKVGRLTLILDHTATNKLINLWQFISNVADESYLADNHSKVILISNGTKVVSIVTSQNLTRGNRYESSIITTDRNVFTSLFDSIQDMIEFHTIGLNEMMDNGRDSHNGSAEDAEQRRPDDTGGVQAVDR